MRDQVLSAEQSLQIICKAVSDELTLRGQHHSCIVGSAILLRVLGMIGCRTAYPLTVQVSIFNKQFREWVDKHGIPEDDESVAACDAAGALTIYVGAGPEKVAEDRWPAHLVVIVPNAYGEKHALLDLTIAQANSPDFGVVLPLVCVKARDEIVSGQEKLFAEVNDCLVCYEAFPNDHSYDDADAWTKSDAIDQAADAIFERLKARGLV